MNRLTSKFILFILLICFASQTAAQDTPLKLILEGVVTDCDFKVPVEGVIINILDSEGYALETRTDKDGYYKIRLKPGLRYVITTDTRNTRQTEYADRYLNSADKGKLNTEAETESKIFRKDFCLQDAQFIRSPYFFFEKNSVEFSSSLKDPIYGPADSSLMALYELLNGFIKNTVIEIMGHADSFESRKEQLSIQRAEIIKKELIKLGIKEERLQCKGYGSNRMLSSKEIRKLRFKALTDSSMCTRRVGIKILSWDYKYSNIPEPPAPSNSAQEIAFSKYAVADSNKTPSFPAGSGHTRTEKKIVTSDRLAPVGPSAKKITLEGYISDCQNKVPIGNVMINVKASDGSEYFTMSDKIGYYSLKLPAHLSYIVTTNSKKAEKTRYSDSYLNTSEKARIDPAEKNVQHFKKDFCLTAAYIHVIFRAVLFEKSSAKYEGVYGNENNRLHDTLALLLHTLREEPQIVIEISAHADSKEPNAQQLSEERVLKVKTDLVKAGINPERLIVKGYGDKKMLIREKEISKLKGSEEREAARRKNRRAVFKVLRWDYESPEAKTKRLAPEFKVEGVVSERDNKRPIEGAAITIVGTDSSEAIIKTDKAGYYSHDLKAGTRYMILCAPPRNEPYDPCWAYKGGEMYYSPSPDKGKISTDSLTESRTFKKDFILIRAHYEFRFPAFNFRKNSVDYGDIDPCLGSADSIAMWYVQMLKDNPTAVIELSGHCSSNESKAERLSLKRAEKIKEELVRRGVPEERLVCKGYSYKRLLVKDAQIAEMKTKEEEETAHNKNRRVTIKYLRFDHPADPQSAPPGITPKKYENEQ